MLDIRDQYPQMFFDTKVVEEKTPKASPPSMTQLMAFVMSKYGVTNDAMAHELANAAEGLVALTETKP